MKSKLYLITTDFPYGHGENSFLLPELPYLTQRFDVTIISHSLSMEQTANLGVEIKVVHYSRKASVLQKLWDSVCFFACRDAYVELRDIIRSGKKVGKRLFESLLFFEEARRFKRFLKKQQIIDESKPAVIYCYWFTYYCFTLAQLYGENPNIKLVTRAHRFDLYDDGYMGERQPFKRQMDRKFDSIVFIAEHGRRYYLEKYAVNGDSNKYRVFHLGVKPVSGPVLKRDERKSEFLLVSCALVIPRKRVEMIVDALAQIHDIPIRWIHFGDGPCLEELRSRCEEKLSSLNNIEYELKGYVDSEEIMRFYGENCVDAFVTTTASEGCPVSIQEAMAYGIPVIGTAVAEIPYMIQGNGILLSENPDSDEVENAIRDILNLDSERANAMREKSYHIWKEQFNAEINAARFAEFLAEVTNRGLKE